jgi:hypothetical protein
LKYTRSATSTGNGHRASRGESVPTPNRRGKGRKSLISRPFGRLRNFFPPPTIAVEIFVGKKLQQPGIIVKRISGLSLQHNLLMFTVLQIALASMVLMAYFFPAIFSISV